MTVVAALQIEGIPVVISDFLITDTQPRPHFLLPTHSLPSATLPRRLNGTQRKCVIINDRLAVGFTGHVEAGKHIFTALRRGSPVGLAAPLSMSLSWFFGS